MRGKLSNRLSQLRKMREEGKMQGDGSESRQRSGTEPEAEIDNASRPPALQDWSRAAPMVLRRSIDVPFPQIAGEKNRILPNSPYRGILIRPENLGRTVFYDFETTGLSGGAGTYIFLAGFGYFVDGVLRVEQVFLEDYPGEPAFLEELRELVDEEKIAVSYNGKRFDSHLLITRSRMGGVEVGMGPQIDLLYPVRTIWKRSIGSCRLSNVEGRVLDRGRIDDIDGAYIPDCYFAYLRGEGSSCMEKVLEHHVRDIVSLAYLLFTVEEAAERPSLLSDSESREGMAALLLKYGDEGKGLSLLEEELDRGSLWAGRIAALAYRRAHGYAEYERILHRMWELEHGYFQGLALSKLYEHRKKDPASALEYVNEIDRRYPFLPEAKRYDLEGRRERLNAKIERRKQQREQQKERRPDKFTS